MRKEYIIDTDVDSATGSFPLIAGSFLTIHHAVQGGSPSGTWHLDILNEADGEWYSIGLALEAFGNPTGSDAGGVANFANPNQGKGRVRYEADSGGTPGGATCIIYQESARN